jgi:hypothetical protein
MQSTLSGHISPGCAVMMISFPHQLLHALCALQHDRVCRGIALETRALLIVWSYQESDHEPSSYARQFFQLALRNYPYVECIFLSRRERKFALSPYRKLTSRARWIRKMLGVSGPARVSFYYAHDASADHTAQAFMQALQAEKNICYGDAPGFLYPSKKPSRTPLTLSLRWLREVFWSSRIGNATPWLAAESAFIAVDFGEWEEGQGLPFPVVIPDIIFSRVLASLRKSFPEIARFERQLSEQPNNVSKAILILSNFTNSKLTSENSELALYKAICDTHLKPGDHIYIKKHAGTSQAFMSKLLSGLGEYCAMAFPSELEHIPIEFFTELHQNCKVISVSSASAIFSRIPGAHANHALTQELIIRFFNQNCQDYMILANNRILQKCTHLQ